MSVSLLKKLAGVAGVLVVLWIVFLYRQVPHEKAPFAKAADSAEQFLIVGGSQKAQLAKQGGKWKVFLNGGASVPAHEEPVKTLLSSLKSLQLEDEISDR